MTCRDFERAWNELIDGEAGIPAPGGKAGTSAAQSNPAIVGLERALLDHAAKCSDCRQVAARYQALRRAVRAWGSPPAPPAGLADRVLAEIQRTPSSAWPIYGEVRQEPGWLALWPMAALAAAAVVLAMALPVLIGPLKPRRADGLPAALHATPVDPGHARDHDATTVALNARALNHAVVKATSATWDLARSASEPTARISRQVLAAATGPEQRQERPGSVTGSESVTAMVSVPSLDSFAPDTAAAGAVLQQVGDRLTTGVRPLSDTARHAFGFLLGPVPPKPEVSINPPAQKGA